MLLNKMKKKLVLNLKLILLTRKLQSPPVTLTGAWAEPLLTCQAGKFRLCEWSEGWGNAFPSPSPGLGRPGLSGGGRNESAAHVMTSGHVAPRISSLPREKKKKKFQNSELREPLLFTFLHSFVRNPWVEANSWSIFDQLRTGDEFNETKQVSAG